MKEDFYFRSLTRNFIEQCLEDAVYVLQMPECAGIGDAPGSVIQVAGMLLNLRMLHCSEMPGRINKMYEEFRPEKPKNWEEILKEEAAKK